MVITTTANCASLELTSDLIDTFEGTPGTDTLRVTVTYNCGTPVVINITSSNILDYIDTGTLTIEPESLSMTDAISNGVYRIKLSLISSTTTNEYLNHYVSCGIECLLIKHYSGMNLLSRITDDTCKCPDEEYCKESSAYAYHQILNYVNSCSEYTYEKACELWKELDYLLDTATDKTPCGCG